MWRSTINAQAQTARAQKLGRCSYVTLETHAMYCLCNSFSLSSPASHVHAVPSSVKQAQETHFPMCNVGRYSHSLPQDLPSRAHCSATCSLGKAEGRQLGTGPLLTAPVMSSLEHQQKRISHARGWLPFPSLAGKTLFTYTVHSFRPLLTHMKTPKQWMKCPVPWSFAKIGLYSVQEWKTPCLILIATTLVEPI